MSAGATHCEHEGRVHSDDLVIVYHGRPEPTLLCGFHQQQIALSDTVDLGNFPRHAASDPAPATASVQTGPDERSA